MSPRLGATPTPSSKNVGQTLLTHHSRTSTTRRNTSAIAQRQHTAVPSTHSAATLCLYIYAARSWISTRMQYNLIPGSWLPHDEGMIYRARRSATYARTMMLWQHHLISSLHSCRCHSIKYEIGEGVALLGTPRPRRARGVGGNPPSLHHPLSHHGSAAKGSATLTLSPLVAEDYLIAEDEKVCQRLVLRSRCDYALFADATQPAFGR